MSSNGANTPRSIIVAHVGELLRRGRAHHHRQADRLAGLLDAPLHRLKREVAAIAFLGTR